MNSKPERWTQDQRIQALKSFFDSEDGRRFLNVFSIDCVAYEDREIFMRDAERRTRFDEEDAGRWWNSLSNILGSNPHQFLALAEPLAQNGITIEELYDCLPDDFDSLALMRAINLARNVKSGGWRALPPPGITNAAGLSVEQIRSRLEEVKWQLDWQSASISARQWWEAFEVWDDNKQRMELVLLLAEELANRKVTVTDFHDAYLQANTENITAILRYLDYLRLKAEARQSPMSEGARRLGLTTGDSGWWLKPARRMTWVRGWTDEQTRVRLEEVKAQLDWGNTAGSIREWWEAFEHENQHRLALVLRSAEELAERNVTITEFHRAFDLSKANDIRANLFYLDYLRLTTEKYQYETVVLDESGETRERRQCEARQFIDELASGVLLEMVEIPGGTFKMGTSEENVEKEIEEYIRYGLKKEDVERWVNSERPPHMVKISPFHMGKFTITQEQWQVVAGWEKIERDLNPNPSHFKDPKDSADRPVERVSWEDAVEFCARLAKKTGRAYRLPTEAEWEYACRAGTTTPFAFGETITYETVNYNSEYPYAKAKKQKFRGETTPVGSLGVANAFGLFDMHGNVWEWCEDIWHQNYDGAPSDGSAWLSGGGSSSRVLRGGSWGSHSFYCRSAIRLYNVPDARDYSLGFRVVVGAWTS
jgi:formylglycine-generating enzyme required for sulfatase activity